MDYVDNVVEENSSVFSLFQLGQLSLASLQDRLIEYQLRLG